MSLETAFVLIKMLNFTLAKFVLAAPPGPSFTCHSKYLTVPDIQGIVHFSATAHLQQNFSASSLLPGTDVVDNYTINFCNVTVTYGHVGWNDTINVSTWLPTTGWNGRILGIGGGGYSGSFGAVYHTAAVGQGFVAIGTDSGHTASLETSADLSSWTLTDTGNPNYYLIEDFGSRSLGELSVIGKHITQRFYGRPPRASYFSGCSGGGRQAFALAQRYPDAFDGLLASSPAIHIESALPAAYFAAQNMQTNHYYPSPCEVRAFTTRAIKSCDGQDGVEDGIISTPQICNFSAHDVVGQKFFCNGAHRSFTEEGANVVQAAWTGPDSDRVSWYPYNKDADLTSAIITTICDDQLFNCSRLVTSSVITGNLSRSGSTSRTDLLGAWFQYFLAKDPNFNVTLMTLQDFYNYLHQSRAEWAQMLGAVDPNLDRFKAVGGKFISWHGLADTILPPKGSSAYYDKVLQLNNDTISFYRHFEAPGVGHCFGGNGPLPNHALSSLIDWVENETPPDTLLASSTSSGLRRPLCPYPNRQVYVGGDSNTTSAFMCTTTK